MPEDKSKISIEKLITDTGKEETVKKNEVSLENVSSHERLIDIEQAKVKQENIVEVSELTEGEGELDDIVGIGNARQQKSRQIKEIEDIMADGLKEAFLQMAPGRRIEFKRIGEETAIKINEIMGKTKIKVRKIIRLLRKWLTMIPGVNKYFLEQKVKIKADKIIALKKNDNNI